MADYRYAVRIPVIIPSSTGFRGFVGEGYRHREEWGWHENCHRFLPAFKKNIRWNRIRKWEAGIREANRQGSVSYDKIRNVMAGFRSPRVLRHGRSKFEAAQIFVNEIRNDGGKFIVADFHTWLLSRSRRFAGTIQSANGIIRMNAKSLDIRIESERTHDHPMVWRTG